MLDDAKYYLVDKELKYHRFEMFENEVNVLKEILAEKDYRNPKYFKLVKDEMSNVVSYWNNIVRDPIFNLHFADMSNVTKIYFFELINGKLHNIMLPGEEISKYIIGNPKNEELNRNIINSCPEIMFLVDEKKHCKRCGNYLFVKLDVPIDAGKLFHYDERFKNVKYLKIYFYSE